MRREVLAGLFGILSSSRMLAAASPEAGSEGASPARVESEPHRFLTWVAPDSCPASEQVITQVEGLLQQEIPTAMPLLVQATIEPDARGFRLELTLRNGDEVGTRELDFSTCEDAADFVALSIALALGSGGIGSVYPGTPGGDAGSESGEPPPSLESSQSAPGADFAEASSPDATSKALVEVPTPSETPSTRSAEEAQTQSPGRERERTRSAWFAGGGLTFASGIVPHLGVGLLLGGGLDLGLWSVRGEGSFFPLNSFQPNGAQNGVDFGALAFRSSACRVISTEMFALTLCAGPELALIFAEERMLESARAPHSGTGLSFAVVGGLEALFRIRPRLSGQIQAEVAYPIVADRFALRDHSLVFDPGPGFRGTLGVRYFF